MRREDDLPGWAFLGALVGLAGGLVLPYILCNLFASLALLESEWGFPEAWWRFLLRVAGVAGGCLEWPLLLAKRCGLWPDTHFGEAVLLAVAWGLLGALVGLGWRVFSLRRRRHAEGGREALQSYRPQPPPEDDN